MRESLKIFILLFKKLFRLRGFNTVIFFNAGFWVLIVKHRKPDVLLNLTLPVAIISGRFELKPRNTMIKDSVFPKNYVYI